MTGKQPLPIKWTAATYPSSRVTRTTSAKVVVPWRTLSQPSSRKSRMPCCTARLRMPLASAF